VFEKEKRVFKSSATLESPSPHQIRRNSPVPHPPPSSSANSFINSHFSADYNNTMSSTTPNSVAAGDCDQQQQDPQQQNNNSQQQQAAAAAAAVASKNAFLELQQAHQHLASQAGIGPPPSHMTGGGGGGGSYGMNRNPYGQMQQQHPSANSLSVNHQLGGYPFSHMTSQNTYAAAAAAAAAGYHHLSPYPSQCPSPPRDGNFFFHPRSNLFCIFLQGLGGCVYVYRKGDRNIY
jgi:hypothetical protein